MPKLTALMIVSLILICSCSKNTVDIQETAQQVGDIMASVDESGGNNNGTTSTSYDVAPTFSRLAPDEVEGLSTSATGHPRTAACVSSDTFSSCSSNVITRTFGGCTILGVTFDGTVTFTWASNSGTSCLLNQNGATVSRSPSFTATGRRGATLAVSKTGSYGQRITRTGATSFTFSNDGIKRIFTASGATLFDFTTQTTSDIGVSGITRSTRVMDGGSLRVTNNLTSVTCDYVPSNVTWASGCNCAVSGSWSGTCSDGKTTSITITGCRTATLNMGGETEDVAFDRCYSL